MQSFTDAYDQARVGVSGTVGSCLQTICLVNQFAVVSVAATGMLRFFASYATTIALDDDCAHPMLDFVFDKGSVARSFFGKWCALHS
jgi:hypothetical protein